MGHGTGEDRGTSPEEVHDIVPKAPETDATKRALATFGRPLWDQNDHLASGRPLAHQVPILGRQRNQRSEANLRD
jgi:hypothetical protein